ncbi:MAG: response regulator [Chitinophagaceae bacterium]
MIKDNKKYDILVIEDNTGDFTLIEEYLKEEIADPVVTRVESFKEASFLLSKQTKIYDVILLDLSLPDKGGEELITNIILLCRQCPVIILTAFADIDFSIKSMALGIGDYLLKDDVSASYLYKSIVYSIERKKANDRLRESENQYINLLNLSPQPMWVYEPESYRFVQVNKAALALYGYSKEEFLGMTIMNIRDKQFVPGKKSLSLKPAADENILNGRFLHYTKSGEAIDVEVYSTAVMIGEKSYRSVIVIDVTEKILVEKKITMAIIKAQEDERYEIGGELHDNVCQILATSQLSLGMMKDYLDSQAIDWFEKCREYIILASDEIRNLSHRLAPVFFDNINLEEAFRKLLDTIKTDENCAMLLHVDTAVNNWPLSRDIQLTLYRILQEQLANILKYAKARTVNIEVIIAGNNLIMTTTDNGVGFDVHKIKRGIGLANISRRAELFSGKAEIESWPGNGCKITIEMPLNNMNLAKNKEELV